MIIGHSHLTSLIAAANESGRSIRAIQLRARESGEIIAGHELAPTLRSEITEALRANGARTLFSVIGGDVVGWYGAFRHPTPYDFVMPGLEDLPLDGDAPILPFAAVAAAMTNSMSKQLQLLKALALARIAPIRHHLPPPLPARFKPKIHMPKKFRGQPFQPKPSSSSFRRKTWLLANEIMSRACRQADITVVAPPPEAIDDEGFMADAYQRDGIHGNAAYGALVLKQMEAAAG